MGLGPIELLVVGFPSSQFNGGILPALKDVVERDILSIVDCLLVMKDLDDNVEFVEIEDAGADSGGVLLANVRIPGMVVDEVLAALAEG